MSTTANPVTSIPGQIRNVQQSVQYRDVIKQASDVVVYIDGQDYLINPYLGSDGVPVPLNDFIVSWTSTYDIDAMVPSGSLTLAVAVEMEHLFRAPGGNNILKTMSEIRVFAKGYFLSQDGNTIYRQIFKGYISSIGYNPTGKMTTISINCAGALGMLDKMQVEQAPSAMSSSPQEFTPFTSTNWNLDPYQSIAFIFIYSSMIDGFTRDSIPQAAMDKNNPYNEAVEGQFVAKWQALLYDLARDVHVFGSPNVNDVISDIKKHLKPNDATTNSYAKEALGLFGDVRGATTETAKRTEQDPFYQALRGYHPDMSFGSIQLLNGRLTTRLERLRYLVNLVGFEAYQDVDGGIVIKPPLYNLDVVNLDKDAAGNVVKGLDPSLASMKDATNPFVVQLAEILTESESEDEAAVRMTRVTARGSYMPGFQFEASKELLATAEDIDIAKLAQFGLRTAPPLDVNWIQAGDGKAVYAFAASELARANRGFRTYNMVIPLRPELKLGFPMYLPHRDMYGYIKSITMNWNKGATATTSVVLDSLRRRPLLPETQQAPDPVTGISRNITLMTPQVNLVQKWASAEKFDQPTSKPPTINAGNIAATAQLLQLQGKLQSLPIPQQLIVAQQVQMLEARLQSGSDYGVNPDSDTNCWRIQLDTSKAEDGTIGVFNRVRTLDQYYYADLRHVRPYTDAKGYELVGPFPWGRWHPLKEAITDFTIADALGANSKPGSAVINPVSAATTTLTNSAAFLFTGDAPATTTESTTALLSAMVDQAALVNNFKVFELSYNSTSALTSQLVATATPTTPPTAADLAATRASTMLSSKTASQSLVSSILQSVPLNSPTVVSTATKTSSTGSTSSSAFGGSSFLTKAIRAIKNAF